MKVRITSEYPGLVISDDGRIQGPSGRWYKPAVSGGRPHPHFQYCGRTLAVHVVVCTAFHGSRPSPVHQAAHRNGVPTDNRAANIRWATPKENQADRERHGTRGVKIDSGQAREIRIYWEHGTFSIDQMAAGYGITEVMVRKIVGRKIWL
jgi:hypothetical protein